MGAGSDARLHTVILSGAIYLLAMSSNTVRCHGGATKAAHLGDGQKTYELSHCAIQPAGSLGSVGSVGPESGETGGIGGVGAAMVEMVVRRGGPRGTRQVNSCEHLRGGNIQGKVERSQKDDGGGNRAI